MLTLQQFIETCEPMTVSEASERLTVDIEQFVDAVSVWVYADDLYIMELNNGDYCCEVFSDSWVGGRYQMVQRLYTEMYATECLGEGQHTVAGLLDTYHTYNELNPVPDHRWLEWFALTLGNARNKER